MTEWRFRFAVGLCCALATAIACGGGDEATGDGNSPGNGPGPAAGTGGQSPSAQGGRSGGQGGRPSAGTAGTGTPAPGTAGTNPGGAECSDSEPFLCTDSETLRVCLDGTYRSLPCSETCETGGFEPGPCNEQTNNCECGEPVNRACFDGADVFCYCAGCTTADEFFDFYWGCIEEATPAHAEILPCLATQLEFDADGNALEPDCDAAAEACFPEEDTTDEETTGTAGSGGSSG